jgi:MFS family permease
MVAMAWQVYALSNAPTALSLVGISMTVPTIAFLLLGGVLSDRLDRRRVMLFADVTRGLAVGTLALLSITGVIELWHVVALVAVYGAGAAFFGPSFDAIVPDVLPGDELAQASSLDQFVRPIALRLAGPAIGGVLIDAVGVGMAFALDAGSFAVSALALLCMRSRRSRAAADHGSVAADIRSGFTYVRRHVWLWATFAIAALTSSAGAPSSWAPCSPPAGSARSGARWSSASAGCPGATSPSCTRRGAWPASPWPATAWPLRCGCSCWPAWAFNALETAGTIVWATAKQRHVPPALLGRVSSLDWLISIGLLPVSFALTGPVSGAVGAQAALVGAGVLGGVITAAALLVPGMRAIEGAPGWRNGEADAGPSASAPVGAPA